MPDFKLGSDAEARERKIIAHGVMGSDFSKAFRNFKCCFQIGLFAAGEPQAATDGVHVRIKGDYKQRRRNAFPSARINIVTADHPPKHKIQPLAGAAAHRGWQRIEIKPAGSGTQLLCKFFKRRQDVCIAPHQMTAQALPEGAVF